MAMHWVKVAASVVDPRDEVGALRTRWIDLGKITVVTMVEGANGPALRTQDLDGYRLQIDYWDDVEKVTRILDKLAHDFAHMYDR